MSDFPAQNGDFYREMLTTELFDINSDSEPSDINAFLLKFRYPWEALPQLSAFIAETGPKLSTADYNQVNDKAWVHKDAIVAASAFFGDNIIIEARAEIRHCAFLRSNAYVGANCVVGNSGELKNSIMLSGSQAAHFNYIGDSILGTGSHLGAGAITSNLKGDGTDVQITYHGERIETNLRKFGAILGVNVDVGCNAVLNPGSVVGSNTRIYPLSMVRGFVPPRSIYKKLGEVIEMIERNI